MKKWIYVTWLKYVGYNSGMRTDGYQMQGQYFRVRKYEDAQAYAFENRFNCITVSLVTKLKGIKGEFRKVIYDSGWYDSGWRLDKYTRMLTNMEKERNKKGLQDWTVERVSLPKAICAICEKEIDHGFAFNYFGKEYHTACLIKKKREEQIERAKKQADEAPLALGERGGAEKPMSEETNVDFCCVCTREPNDIIRIGTDAMICPACLESAWGQVSAHSSERIREELTKGRERINSDSKNCQYIRLQATIAEMVLAEREERGGEP